MATIQSPSTKRKHNNIVIPITPTRRAKPDTPFTPATSSKSAKPATPATPVVSYNQNLVNDRIKERVNLPAILLEISTLQNNPINTLLKTISNSIDLEAFENLEDAVNAIKEQIEIILVNSAFGITFKFTPYSHKNATGKNKSYIFKICFIADSPTTRLLNISNNKNPLVEHLKKGITTEADFKREAEIQNEI